MTVTPTEAAKVMQENTEMSSHQVISLLMAGALERVSQARTAIRNGNEEDEQVLLGKIIAIINGLRNSLNMEEGGDIAVNLDGLYDYIVNRVESINEQARVAAMDEIEKLINEVKVGWDDIDTVKSIARAS